MKTFIVIAALTFLNCSDNKTTELLIKFEIAENSRCFKLRNNNEFIAIKANGDAVLIKVNGSKIEIETLSVKKELDIPDINTQLGGIKLWNFDTESFDVIHHQTKDLRPYLSESYRQHYENLVSMGMPPLEALQAIYRKRRL